MTKAKSIIFLAVAVLALAVVAAGCGSSSDSSTSASGETSNASDESWEKVDLDVGDQEVEVQGPIRLAYFAPGQNNSWLQSAIKGAEDAIGEIPGASITVFNGNWDPQNQFNQAQTALQSGDYNAALIDPVDTQLMCNIMTKTAPDEGVVVESITHPLCSRYSKEGEERWAPGTLGYVDANDTTAELRAYIEHIAETNPGPQQMAAISGPPTDGMTKNLEKAIEEVESSGKYPEFKVADLITTEFSLTQSQEQLSALLQSNPDISIVFVPATSDCTQGAYAAIAAAGKTGEVKLYDKGGSEWVANGVKSGEVEATQPQYPYSNTKIAVEQLDKAFHGEPTKRFIPDYGVEYSPEDQKMGFQQYTKENIDEYEPEY